MRQVIGGPNESCEFEIVDASWEAISNEKAQLFPSAAGNCSRCVSNGNDSFAFVATQNGTRLSIYTKGFLSSECDSLTCEVFPQIHWTGIILNRNASSCVAFNVPRRIGNASLKIPLSSFHVATFFSLVQDVL